MGTSGSKAYNYTHTTKHRWTSKEIENNIKNVLVGGGNTEIRSIMSTVDTLGWNRYNTDGVPYKKYEEKLNRFYNVLQKGGNLDEILNELSVSDAPPIDVFTINDIQPQQGGMMESGGIFDIDELSSTPATIADAPELDIGALMIGGSNFNVINSVSYSPTSAAPVSDINVISFTSTDASLGLNMRHPQSGNIFA